jgi:hypothetical protein
MILFCVGFDDGASNCYWGDRVPTLEEAKIFCKPHIDATPEWDDVVFVGEVSEDEAKDLWDLSVFEREDWLVFNGGQIKGGTTP